MDGVTGRKVTLTEMPNILNPVITLNVFSEFHSYHLCIWPPPKKNLFMNTSGLWLIIVCGLFYHTNIQFGEGNGNPLHYSCLENPMGGGVWLQSMGLLGVRHDWSDLAAAATYSSLRVPKRQPTYKEKAKGPSLVAQMVKNLTALWETWVRSLGQEDSPGRGHGNPLQYSCLENCMDRGVWRATVYGVAKNITL